MNIIRVGSRTPNWANVTSATVLLAALGGAVTVYTGWFSFHPEGASTAPIRVTVARAVQKNIRAWQELPARLEAADKFSIRSRVEGVVRKIHYRAGALVKSGDILFTMDDTVIRQKIRIASARVERAITRVESANTEAERQQLHVEISGHDDGAFERAKREQDEAVNELREAQTQLEAARMKLNAAQVRAPVDGTMSAPSVTEGTLVSSSGRTSTLASITPASPVYATFDRQSLEELQPLLRLKGDASALSVGGGLPAMLKAPDQPRFFSGFLRRIGNGMSAGGKADQLRAVFDNYQGHLVPGEAVRIKIPTLDHDGAVFVSEQAIDMRGDDSYVVVVDETDRAFLRKVQTGTVVNGLRIVTSGLKAGERVVLGGLKRLADGTKVLPQLSTAPADGPSSM
ncbi:efflux RND transporter periplasmic adaptor subunit [Roseateles noduli]|uniref:efflux RND transporter periplasmic adaptor subunit n=1 Tax=Roseateles noduli TaxID=2052484 RepID=UPI003D648571